MDNENCAVVSNRGDTAWDSRNSGEEIASDVYVYMNICGEERQLKGGVTLLR